MKVLLLEEEDENMQLSDRMLLPVKDGYSRLTGYGFNCT